EPVPPPRPGVPLAAQDRLRRTTEILRLHDTSGASVWAAHGHARRAAGPAADRILDRLCAVTQTTVGALAESCALRPDSPELLTLLDELYRVRAVDTAP
ncbi:hypothetical protein G3I40_09845, partial [Streptomyces sp. SID14478]|nr:hypothetical protein [Streptomyces sp. SID14478]